MKKYVKIENDIVVYVVQSNEPQVDLIEIDFDIGQSNQAWLKYKFSEKKWIDIRTDQQKNFDKDKEIKSQRNLLLISSDWTQIPNNPLTQEQQEAWAVYRQELRDVTSQSGYPFNVIWPTSPQG